MIRVGIGDREFCPGAISYQPSLVSGLRYAWLSGFTKANNLAISRRQVSAAKALLDATHSAPRGPTTITPHIAGSFVSGFA